MTKKGTSNRLTSWFLHSVGNSFLWLSFLHSASLKVSIHMGQRHWFYSKSSSPKSRNWHWNLKLSNEEYYCRVNGSSEVERGGSHLWAQHLRGDGRQIRSLRSSLATEEVQDQPELHGTLPPPPTNAKTSMQTKTVLSEIYRTPNCVGLLKAILVISNPSHTRLHLFKRNCYASFPMAEENAAFWRQ